jgi:hypothetical protein
MMYRFTANNHTVGYAIVFKCAVRPKTNYLYLMNTISENLSLYFQQERFKNRVSSEFYEPLMAEIMGDPNAQPEKYASRVESVAGLHMNARYLLAKVSYEDQTDMPYSFVCWNLSNAILTLKPFIYQNELYILRVRGEKENYATFLSETEEEEFRRCFRNVEFQCGISNTFFSILDLPMAAVQCQEAISLGQRYYQKKEFYEFKDCYLYYLLEEMKKNQTQKMIESPSYIVLKKYDEANHTDLCDIFMRYLENGRNINQTSTAIFLHRNTVLNKVKKATTVMQNECDGYQAMISYILSYLNDHPDEHLQEYQEQRRKES